MLWTINAYAQDKCKEGKTKKPKHRYEWLLLLSHKVSKVGTLATMRVLQLRSRQRSQFGKGWRRNICATVIGQYKELHKIKKPTLWRGGMQMLEDEENVLPNARIQLKYIWSIMNGRHTVRLESKLNKSKTSHGRTRSCVKKRKQCRS